MVWELTLVRSTTRFCSRLTSASWCSRFFFSSNSWLCTSRISSWSCCRVFSSIRALRKIRQTCEMLRAASPSSQRSGEPQRRSVTTTVPLSSYGCTTGNWGAAVSLSAVVRKRYERRTTPGTAFLCCTRQLLEPHM